MKSKIKQIVLDNGLRVFLDYLPYHRECAIRLGINVGSFDETSEIFGFSHFIEHLFYKSNKFRSMREIMVALDKTRAEDDASTDSSITDFNINCSSRFLPDAARIIFEAISNVDFNEDELEKEKTSIITEINRYLNKPPVFEFDYVFIPAVFGKTALARQICATSELVKKIKKDDLIRFKKHFYQPKNMAIIISGCFNEERIMGALRNSFGKLSGSFENIRQPLDKIPGRKFQVIKRREVINQVFLTVGLPILNFYKMKDEEVAAMSFWQTLLCGGASTRLSYRLCTDEVLTYNMSDSLENWQGAGLVYFRIKGLEPSNFGKALKIIFEEIRFVNLNVIKKEEMGIAKGLFFAKYSDNLQDLEFRTQEILNSAFGFSSYDFRNIAKEVRKMNSRRFRKIIRKLIPYSRRKWTVSALAPKGFRVKL